MSSSASSSNTIANATSPQSSPEPGSPTQHSAASAASDYAGDLEPRAAWEMLSREKDCVLVDCRSRAEWSWVGMPDLSPLGKRPVAVEWQRWTERGMQANAAFADDVAAAGVARAQPVIFLCRSGGRSRSAAILMTRAGWARCYNLAGGFEGPHDGLRHRGTSAGWKAAGLPWVQE